LCRKKNEVLNDATVLTPIREKAHEGCVSQIMKLILIASFFLHKLEQRPTLIFTFCI